ncbi:glycosyltransferase [Nocardioides sp. CER19]|uniref:glycosyltransferase n=1 Tax=Nocardioides sp. CER19 TaxID=3038538 RepID=UPI00244A48AB|nr:glycosyltransferase [Nocardioides sp. CER19]MDH2414647.1 glycosyltransferase [Nocardioides sp. CER19]
MRVTAWRDAVEFCFLYRLGLPLNAAADQGLLEVAFDTGWSETGGADVLVGQRAMSDQTVRRWRAAEAPLKVLEYDDDLLSLRADNPAWATIDRSVYLREWVPAIREALAEADLVTVSVPHLAERLGEHTDASIVVLPNTIHHSLLDVAAPVRAPGQPLRVGWAGTATHQPDWEDNAPAVARALRAVDATMVVVGADYSSLIGYPVEVRPWESRLTGYYQCISDFHVALAPLRDDEFNRCKSPLKALEAAALGIPVVASAAGPYLDFVVDGETGFLCRNRADWERAIRTLARDEPLRRAMGERARDVARSLVTRDWAPRWAETYATALSRQPATA